MTKKREVTVSLPDLTDKWGDGYMKDNKLLFLIRDQVRISNLAKVAIVLTPYQLSILFQVIDGLREIIKTSKVEVTE